MIGLILAGDTWSAAPERKRTSTDFLESPPRPVATRLKEVEGKVLTACRDRVSPSIAPLVEELPRAAQIGACCVHHARNPFSASISPTGGSRQILRSELVEKLEKQETAFFESFWFGKECRRSGIGVFVPQRRSMILTCWHFGMPLQRHGRVPSGSRNR